MWFKRKIHYKILQFDNSHGIITFESNSMIFHQLNDFSLANEKSTILACMPVADPGFPRGGCANPRGRGQHTILPNFPKKCMKLKEFGLGGGPAFLVYLPRSANAVADPGLRTDNRGRGAAQHKILPNFAKFSQNCMIHQCMQIPSFPEKPRFPMNLTLYKPHPDPKLPSMYGLVTAVLLYVAAIAFRVRYDVHIAFLLCVTHCVGHTFRFGERCIGFLQSLTPSQNYFFEEHN